MPDRSITVSIGGSRTAKTWVPTTFTWLEFVKRFRSPLRGTETHAAYMKLTKAQQDNLKDVGGFVGGELRNMRRKPENVVGRDLVTLDMDTLPAGSTDTIIASVDLLNCAAMIYSTRKHGPGAPRLRIVIPTDRTVTPDEYEAIARKIAEKLGIQYCDRTTFQTYRLMYWANVSADSEYIYETFEAPFLVADDVLAEYADWHDMTQWPQVPAEAAGGATRRTRAPSTGSGKLQPPGEKKGAVGAFCRVYGIHRVLEELLPDVYAPTSDPDRFTYSHGSTFGGAIVYDDLWLYSHHATDPCSEQSVNAWDLVRIHRFGSLDVGHEDASITSLPSTKAMKEWALTLPDVIAEMDAERTRAADDFSAPLEGEVSEGNSWMEKLVRGGNGGIAGNAVNVMLILNNDPKLLGRLVFNTFHMRIFTLDTLPWNDIDPVPRRWNDEDEAGLRNYMNMFYGLTNTSQIRDGVTVYANQHRVDDIRDYLDGLEWDEIPRIDTLLPRYLLADDTPYVRAVTRKSLVAAVARQYDPGRKFDFVLTLVGAQGVKKSTFIRYLCGDTWFTDSVQDFSRIKDLGELLKGYWLVEIPEVDRLSSWNEAAMVKQGITRQYDDYREAYERHAVRHPRRCIFIATTNKEDFLIDSSGNRRWWIVRCHATRDKLGADIDLLKEERDQIWAEAVYWYKHGETLYLSDDLEDQATDIQTQSVEADPWRGIIEDYIAKGIPEGWADMDLAKRRVWLDNDFDVERTNVQPRMTLAPIEVWCECLGNDIGKIPKPESNRIARIIRGLPGWKSIGPRQLQIYGSQRCFGYYHHTTNSIEDGS